MEAQPEVDTAFDFVETRLITSAFDLLISNNSSLAHLTGTLGHRFLLLLSDFYQWRWGPDGESTAWSPSARLVRQRPIGDWTELIQRLMAEQGARIPSPSRS